jgi:hypothetical protein
MEWQHDMMCQVVKVATSKLAGQVHVTFRFLQIIYIYIFIYISEILSLARKYLVSGRQKKKAVSVMKSLRGEEGD